MSMLRVRKLRLVDKVKGSGQGSGPRWTWVCSVRLGLDDACPYTQDSELPDLPPRAVSGGWGDMSWLRR